MHAMPAPLGATGAGRATPPPPPESEIVAPPPPPPPPQASALKICNLACFKVKSITQTEERFAFDDPGLPAGHPAGEALTIRLPGGGVLLLCVPPGACTDAAVRRAAAACGLAPSQLALFCGGRRLGGQALISRAGGVRSGGTLRVVQRLAGGSPELTHEAALTAAFQKFAGGNGRITKEGFVAALTHPGGGRAITREEAEAEFGLHEAGVDGPVSCEAIVTAWVVPAPPPHLAPEAEETARVATEEAARLATVQAAAEEAAILAAASLVTEQAAAEEAARVAAEEAACLATEQAAAEEPTRVAAEEAARLATEQADVEEAASLAAEEAARLVTEQASAEEPARVGAEEAARLVTEQAAAEEAASLAAARLVTEQAAAEEAARMAAEEAARLVTEQASAARVAAEEAARLATEQAAAEEEARVAAEEAARLATEQAATVEPATVAVEEASRLAKEQAAAEEPARVAADCPPHLPPAREVKLDEEKMVEWKDRGGTELEAVLESGAVALLDAEWVIARAASSGVLLPRQALPDEAFLSLSEVQARTCSYGPLPVVCVSHCWLQPDHPDPRGYNLRAVARALASLTKWNRPVGVFLDFCSIHQNCRDVDGAPQDTAFAWLGSEKRFADGAVGRIPAEDVLFKQALGSLGIFCAHQQTRVLMMTAFPPDYFTATYERSGNVKPYVERGWCFCESSWAMMVKDCDYVLDLGKDTGEGPFDEEKCTQGRTAPVLPEEFVVQLESKGFTDGSTDSPLVADLYSKGFKERFGVVTDLDNVSLGWGDEEARVVARVLPHAPALTWLKLNNNKIGDEGARALAETLPHASALEILYLGYNSIGAAGACALAGALPRTPALRDLGPQTRLQLDWRRWRARAGRGAAARAGAGGAQTLPQLDWRRGRAGAGRGAAARAGAEGALPQVQHDWRQGAGCAARGVGDARRIHLFVTSAGCSLHPGLGPGLVIHSMGSAGPSGKFQHY